MTTDEYWNGYKNGREDMENLEGMEFRYQYEPGKSQVIMRLGKDVTIIDVLVEFEGFLQACGYTFRDGEHLGFEYDEESKKEG